MLSYERRSLTRGDIPAVVSMPVAGGLGTNGAAILEPLTLTRTPPNACTHRFFLFLLSEKDRNRKMAWQTAPGMLVIIGGFSLVGAMFAGVDGLANWIYKKPRHIQQDNFNFLMNKKYGYGGRKL